MRLALLAIALFLCGQVPADAGSPARRSPSRPEAQKITAQNHWRHTCPTEAGDDVGNDFSTRACYVDPTFRPEQNRTGANYRAPTCLNENGSVKQATSAQKAALKTAYRNSPPKMQQKLCGLSEVFVTTDSHSWGFWEFVDQGGGDDVFIAVAEDVLKNGTSLVDRENSELVELLPKLAGWIADKGAKPRPPAFTAQSPSTESLVVSVLAHELAHILFFDVNADQNAAPGRPSQNSACYTDVFIGGYWTGAAKHRRMVKYKDKNGKPKRKSELAAINTLIAKKKYDDASREIRAVYDEFGSLLAASSPEEDFVETFRYMALSHNLTDLTLEFEAPSEKINVINILENDKVQCIKELGASPL